VDIQCAAQAIDTFSFFSDRDPEALDMAMRVAEWTIANLQDRSGYFYYREYPMLKARTPYFHWGQATMFKALAHLLSRLRTPASRQLENVANSPLS
jgi:polysaccharide biosynthesis protein VpsJ